MPGKTPINWSELSWASLFTGCTRITSECDNCYAEILTATRLREQPRYKDLAVIRGDGKAHWTNEVKFWPENLVWPVKKQKGSLIFTNSMSDPFHKDVKQEWRDQFFAAMLLGNQHVYQVLTKRPGIMAAYVTDPYTKARVHLAARKLWQEWYGAPTKQLPKGKPFPYERLIWPLPHVWLGCSVGSQKSAEKFAPELLRIPEGWLLWWSAEPLIGRIQPRAEWFERSGYRNRVAWVVSGGESGLKGDARPMLPEWANELRDACARYDVAYWQKQPGNWREVSAAERLNLVGTDALRFCAENQTVCALDVEGRVVRGAKVVTELSARDGVPLFRYSAKKDANSPYRQFPPFPATFARADELNRRAASYGEEEGDAGAVGELAEGVPEPGSPDPLTGVLAFA